MPRTAATHAGGILFLHEAREATEPAKGREGGYGGVEASDAPAGAARAADCAVAVLASGGEGNHSAPTRKEIVRVIVAITGASGAIYAQRLLDNLDPEKHEVHLVLSRYATAVIQEELSEGLRLRPGVVQHNLRSMSAPFASGSNAFDAMIVIPCSMGTLGRIAHGLSDDLLLRAADVMLKERRRLVLVPREAPLNLVHVRNFELLIQAGAVILPANPSFYHRPATLEALADTVVARVLDHAGIEHHLGARWGEERE
jgi:4-hydroxy-3-polyprenylbenzoate decarboxylase